MKRRPSRAGQKPSAAFPLIVLAAALLLSVPAVWNSVQFWLRLPPVRNLPLVYELLLGIEFDRLETEFGLVNRNLPTEAREAFALRLASKMLKGTLAGLGEPGELQPAIGQAVGTLSKSQVGRLQQAAARMWLLEQAGEPIEKWWPALRVFLEGMQHANLAHYQQPLVQHWARAYEAVGHGRGTAYGLAEDLVGHRHGPLLQFSVDRLQRVIEERQQAGDTAAATTCRGVLYRWLQQWVLEPGPAGLRLLAADLLASSLEADHAAATTPELQALADDLREWRRAYHQAARQRPVAIMAPQRRPALAPVAHERFFRRFALSIWLGAATLASAVLALTLAWAWLGRGRSSVGRRRLALNATIVVTIVIGIGLAWIYLWPDSIREDVRGDFSQLRFWWRYPLAAAGLTLTFTLAAGLLQRSPSDGQSRFVARLGAVAGGTWLVLAVMLWGSAIAGESARRDYEQATRAAQEDAVAALVGSDAERLLTRLRRWEP